MQTFSLDATYMSNVTVSFTHTYKLRDVQISCSLMHKTHNGPNFHTTEFADKRESNSHAVPIIRSLLLTIIADII